VASAPKTEELQVAMQSRLTRIDEYLQSLNMELNASKTQALAFFTESFPDLTVRGQAVQNCKSFKYLGVHIDCSLSWDIHAQHVINKVHKNLFVLHRCSGAANIDRRRLLFRAYIYPHFLYGIELFMHCTVALRAKLEALLRRCCRLVMRDTGLFHRITRVSLFSALNVLPLRLTFQYSSAVILYNVLVLNRVPSLRTLFEVVQATHYNSRRTPPDVIELRLPSVNTERARHNFAYWGALLWNSLPVEVRRGATLSVFTRLYLLYLQTKLEQAIQANDHYSLLEFL